DYLISAFSQAEWAAAFTVDPTGSEGTLLPVRVRACRPEGLLAHIIYVDLVGLSEHHAKTALLAAVKRSRAKPIGEPPFPTRAQSIDLPQFPGRDTAKDVAIFDVEKDEDRLQRFYEPEDDQP